MHSVMCIVSEYDILAMAASYGGYDCSFVEAGSESLDTFTCNICTNFFEDPHLTGCCRQHFCDSCLNYWFSVTRKKSCPHCRAEGKQFVHVLDKRLKHEIDSLRIHCTNKEEGCQWIGEVGSLKDHLESASGCGFVEVKCLHSCGKNMIRKYLENHLKNECYLRPYQCEHCGYKSTYWAITGIKSGHVTLFRFSYHYEVCPEYPLPCPNWCGRNDIKRKDVKDHFRQCPKRYI